MTPEQVVAGALGCDEATIDDDSSTETIPEWDSLGHINLIIALETEYGTSFSPEETVDMTTVRAIKDALRAHDVQW